MLREGSEEVVLIGVGKMASRALDAASLLVADGHDVTVLDPRVIRPVDPALLAHLEYARLVVTVEDGVVHGGAGQFLRTEIEREAESRGVLGPVVVTLGVPTSSSRTARRPILRQLGLDEDGIAASVAAAITRVGIEPAVVGRAGPRGAPSNDECPDRLAGGGTAPEVGLDAERIMAKATRRTSRSPPSSSLAGSVRADLLAIYGYCRFVDDVGDLAPGDRLAALDEVEAELDATFKGCARGRRCSSPCSDDRAAVPRASPSTT